MISPDLRTSTKPYDAGEWRKVKMGKGEDGSSLSVTATVFTFSPHFLPTIPGAIKGGIYKHLLHLALSKTVQLAKLVYTSLLGLAPKPPRVFSSQHLSSHRFLIRDLHTQTPDTPGYLLFFKYVPYSFSFHCLNEVNPHPPPLLTVRDTTSEKSSPSPLKSFFQFHL